MDSASLWGSAHILLFAVWLAIELAILAVTARIKDTGQTFDARAARVARANALHVVARLCFALILPTGVELTAAINVYPLTPGLRTASWIIGGVWLVIILIGTSRRGGPLSANLRIVELVFQAFLGLSLVAYGLKSLATGAPIDDPWFAAKLFLFGVLFWSSIAADVGFRPFYAPFLETAQEGATPEREEAIAAAVNHALAATTASAVLIVTIAFFGYFKPF